MREQAGNQVHRNEPNPFATREDFISFRFCLPELTSRQKSAL